MPRAFVTFSVVNMRRDSRFLSTTMGLVALLVLLAITAAPVQGGDVFQCPDGKGGAVWRDVPCSAPAPDQQPPAQTLSPDEPSRPRKEAMPPSHKRAPSPARQTSEPRSSHCLSVQSVKAQTQSHNQLAVELQASGKWDADLYDLRQQEFGA